PSPPPSRHSPTASPRSRCDPAPARRELTAPSAASGCAAPLRGDRLARRVEVESGRERLPEQALELDIDERETAEIAAGCVGCGPSDLSTRRVARHRGRLRAVTRYGPQCAAGTGSDSANAN